MELEFIKKVTNYDRDFIRAEMREAGAKCFASREISIYRTTLGWTEQWRSVAMFFMVAFSLLYTVGSNYGWQPVLNMIFLAVAVFSGVVVLCMLWLHKVSSNRKALAENLLFSPSMRYDLFIHGYDWEDETLYMYGLFDHCGCDFPCMVLEQRFDPVGETKCVVTVTVDCGGIGKVKPFVFDYDGSNSSGELTLDIKKGLVYRE